MVTLEEISVALEHPFVLLVIGALISGVLVAWLTNRWQDRRTERENKLEDRRKQLENELEDRRQKQQNELEDRRKEREFEVENHRKELEIKVDIVSKMDEIISSAIGSVSFHQLRNIEITTPAQKDAVYEDMKKLYADASIIQSMVGIYSSEGIKKEWEEYVDDLLSFKYVSLLYFFKERTEAENEMLKDGSEDMEEYFSKYKKKLEEEQSKYMERYLSDKNKFPLPPPQPYYGATYFGSQMMDDLGSMLGDQGAKIQIELLQSRFKTF